MYLFCLWGLLFLNVTTLFPPLGGALAAAVFAHNAPHPTPSSPASHLYTVRTLVSFTFCWGDTFSETCGNDDLKEHSSLLPQCLPALNPCKALISVWEDLTCVFLNLMYIFPSLDYKSHESRDHICLISWHMASWKCLGSMRYSINITFVTKHWNNTLQKSSVRENERNGMNRRGGKAGQMKIHISHFIVCRGCLYGHSCLYDHTYYFPRMVHLWSAF